MATSELVGQVQASEAGPLPDGVGGLPEPPMVQMAKPVQLLRFSSRQTEFLFGANRRLGEVFRFHGVVRGRPAVTSHPSHIESLMRAKVPLVPTLTSESPLRPIVGPRSVLTANGPRHLRQRKLLLPPFHGEAIAHYQQMIEDATAQQLATWPRGRTVQLAPRMQTITLDVIMAGIFGIEGRLSTTSAEYGLRQATRGVLASSTLPLYQLVELMNVGKDEPVGLTKAAMDLLDAFVYRVIAKRRRTSLEGRRDILSLLLQATTDEGEHLTDRELRDELLTLVLAGHETTANQLAWAFERLVRTPEAHERLNEAVRTGTPERAAEEVEHVIQESMRSRPVIPIIGRRVQAAWRLGDYAVPAGTPVSMSILLLHHREDLYPDPYSFRPERWEGHKPGTYEWLPFGGGTRRCLGAALALAEMRIVLRQVVEAFDVAAVDPEPEHALHRNVTMIPAHNARVVLTPR